MRSARRETTRERLGHPPIADWSAIIGHAEESRSGSTWMPSRDTRDCTRKAGPPAHTERSEVFGSLGMRDRFVANRRMLSRLRALEGKKFSDRRLEPRLSVLIDEGFVQRYGCILYAALKERARPRATRKGLMDKTGIECFVNHVHVDDYIKGDPFRQLQQGMAFARKLSERLERSYPRTRFQVIVAQNKYGVTVRFHKRRRDEKWLNDSLESYKDDAICVLEAGYSGTVRVGHRTGPPQGE
jgi:hypothetical protein